MACCRFSVHSKEDEKAFYNIIPMKCFPPWRIGETLNLATPLPWVLHSTWNSHLDRRLEVQIVLSFTKWHSADLSQGREWTVRNWCRQDFLTENSENSVVWWCCEVAWDHGSYCLYCQHQPLMIKIYPMWFRQKCSLISRVCWLHYCLISRWISPGKL